MRIWTYLFIALAALVVLPWDWNIIPGPMQRNTAPTPADEPQDGDAHTRRTVYFNCSGVQCQAWLYMPTQPYAGDGPPPIVVGAHGLGCQKDFGLTGYAERFARAGFATLLFDYRTFGGSGGEPRHWVSPARHLEDYVSAVEYVKSELRGAVDANRINLWGTSFSGGHVLTLAGTSLRDNVTSVISQVPFTDGHSFMLRNLKTRPLVVVRGVLAGLHDTLRRLARYPPAYLALVGAPGGYAMMDLDAHDSRAFFATHPRKRQGGWRNMVRASLALEGAAYRPIKHVPAIKAPVLYLAASNDTLCPLAEVQAAVKATPDARLASRACGHFDVYSGLPFPFYVQHMLAFLRHTNGLPPLAMSVAEARTGQDHHTPAARAEAAAVMADGTAREAAATDSASTAEL